MSVERVALCLNLEDPEQRELYEFVTKLPNAKKRNASAFLKTLVDREYQKKKEGYWRERNEKKTQNAPLSKSIIKTDTGGIQINLARKDVNKDAN